MVSDVMRSSFVLVLLLGLVPIVRADDLMEVFLADHCLRCHGPQKEKGHLRIDQISRDFKSGTDGSKWGEIMEKIKAGEMPPEEEDQPTEAQIAMVISQIDERVREGRAARMASRPPVAHYRLSRKEYENTIYDLLGVRYDPTQPGQLNEDPRWQGYERIGSQLSLASSHVERYYRAAQSILERAFPEREIEPRKVRKTAAELRYNGGQEQQAFLDQLGLKGPLRALIYPGRLLQGLSPNWFGQIGPEHSGLYRMRLKASGIRPPSGQTAHLRIGKETDEENNEGLIEFDILASEDEPEIYEFEVFLEMPTQLHLNVVATDIIDRRKGAHYRNALSGSNYLFTHSSETQLLNPTAPMMFDDEGRGVYSMVLLDWIEWEGPIVTQEERNLRKNLIPLEDTSLTDVAQSLRRFTQRAWRRPVALSELDPYLSAYQSELEAGESAASAFRVALLGILTSRNFTYLVEGDPHARESLNDFELASRLSFFLWSSMPDEALMEAARQGKLLNGGLEDEVDRMLNDPKIDRFISDFPRQWLQLHRLGMFPPDRKLYPDYDVWLEASFREEIVHFFREVLSKNLPLQDFLDSDWTMVNPRLSEFYGLPISTQSDFQHVSLPPELHRGGLLTMGGILGLTSDGTRHRPVHRGVWLSEVILGQTPPSPPANVNPIEPNSPDLPKATIRQKIEAHGSNPNCAACHRSIDPLGLAFEQFDAVGAWRTHERIEQGKGEDPQVDPSGHLPDGRAFEDAEQFKALLIADHDRFLHAFVEHLSTYALRRVLSIDDRDELDAIVRQSREQNSRLKDLIRTVALSELLKKR